MWRTAPLILLCAAASSCADERPTDAQPTKRGAIGTPFDAAETRAALVRATQESAEEAHAMRAVQHDAALLYIARAQTFDAHFTAIEVGLGASAESPRVSLSSIGCAANLERASAGVPSVAANRISYTRSLGGRSLTEWYVAGPLGLEQGFTIDAPPACTVESGELVLDIALDAAAIELADTGDVVHFRGGGVSFRYSDLYARDSVGQTLPTAMELSAVGVMLHVDVADAIFPIEIDPLIAQDQAKLVASDAAPGATFGRAVAVSGDTAVIGAVADTSDPGAAYVYVRSGGAWVEQQKLTPADPTAGKMFGSAVAVSTDTIVVGAPGEDIGAPGIGTDRGSAYVFVRAGGVWSQQQKLLSLDVPDVPSSLGDRFGTAVALQADTAIVGADGDDNGPSFPASSDRGAAYVFTRSGTTWSQQQKLVAGDAAQSDHFARSLALSNDSVVIGSSDEDDDDPFTSDTDHGSVYVFVRSGSTWSQQQKLTPTTAAYAGTGRAVAIDADTLLVSGNADSRAYVRSGSTWALQQTFSSVGSVAVFGDTAAIGDGQLDHSGLVDAGGVNLFARTGTTWSPESVIVADDAAQLDRFGASIALAGDTLVVGAAGQDDAGSDAGAAYAFVVLEVGDVCAFASDCASGFCVDGVCCAEACGGGIDDCQVCATSLGATANGLCTPITGPGCDTADGSEEFIITCETIPPQKPGVAVGGSLGLASWVANTGSIHAARFDEEGEVLDPAAIDLGVGPPQGPLATPTTTLASLVVATASGYAVVGLFEANDGVTQYLTAQYRQVDPNGSVSPAAWQPIHTVATGITIDAEMWLEDAGFDGATSYVVLRRMDEQGMTFPISYRVFQLGSTSPVLTVLSTPTWGGFGCRTGSCLATWLDNQTNTPTARVIGQPAVALPAFYNGTVVGTPAGFLGAGSQLVAYATTGNLSAGPIPLAAPALDAVFDGVATRAAWLNGGDMMSLTAADNATIISGPSLVVSSSPSQFQLASFGNERTVAVFQPGAGVTARFLGNLPATVPTGCPTGSGGGGGGGAGAGGDGGGGTGNGGGSGGVGGSAGNGGTSAGGNGGFGGNGGDGGTNVGGSGGETAGGASPTGGAPSGGNGGEGGFSAGGAPTGGQPSSTGGSGVGASPVGGSAAGGSGADGGTSDGCDCISAGSSSSSGSSPGWVACLLALVLVQRRRRR